MTKRVRWIFAAVCVLLAGWASAIYVVGPEHAWWSPKCVFHLFTGLQCPSCGSTRAVYHLMHGHWAEGLRCNPFVVLSVPYFLLVAYTTFSASSLATRLRPYVQGKVAIWSYVGAYMAWWLLRNLLGL